MTEEDMESVADSFAKAASSAKRAGSDMAFIHGGHGWLLTQFVSPLERKRKDKYGGSLENRARFPINAVLFFACDDSRAVTGQALVVDKGMCL